MPSVVFFVAAPSLASASNKPKHLATLKQSRSSSRSPKQLPRSQKHFRSAKNAGENASAGSKAAAIAERRQKKAAALAARIRSALANASSRRSAFLAARSAALAAATKRARRIAAGHAAAQDAAASALASAIASRQMSSAARRERLRTIPRSRLLDPSSWAAAESAAVRSESALAIQSWWRSVAFKRAAAVCTNVFCAAAESNKLSQVASELPFAKITAILQSKAVIGAASDLVSKAAAFHPSVDVPKKPARVLLSAYLVASHPSETLQANGEQEQHLIHLAKTLVGDLEDLLASAHMSVRSSTKSFLRSFSDYSDAFEEWKSKDTVAIIDNLIAHFIDLERLWISVMNQEDATTEWAPRIDMQQRRIRSRLAAFGQHAIHKLEAERARAHESMSAPEPSEASQPKERSTSPQMFRPASPRRNNDSVAHSSRSPSTSSLSSRNRNQSTPQPEKNDQETTDSSAEPRIQPSKENNPPAIQAIAPEFGQGLSNELLAHELLMDPEFALKRPKRSEFEEKVAQIAKKAFFDAVREELAANIYDKHVIGIVSSIRDSLLAMVSESGKVAAEIKEALDLELIRHQISHGVFDLHKCILYAGAKMMQLCAPMRDASIRAVASESDMAAALESILDILDDMKLDLANYRLQAIKPHLQRQAVEYEREKFNKAVESGKVSLGRTRAWLKSSFESLQAVAASRNPENIVHPDLAVRYESVFVSAILSLIFDTNAITPETVPETFAMDAKRLFEFQNEAQAITIVAALVMLTKNIVPELRNDAKLFRSLSDKLFVLLEDAQTNVDNLALLIKTTINDAFTAHGNIVQSLADASKTGASNEAMASAVAKATSKQLTTEQEAMIKTMIDKTLSIRDPIYSLLSRRIQQMVRQHMERDTFRRDTLGKFGLDVVADKLAALSSRIVLLAKHNKDVYCETYDGILHALVE